VNMATVPRVTSLSNVELRPVSGTLQSVPNATPGAFGADAAAQTIQGARQLGAAGDRLAQVALEIKNDNDIREAKEADVRFSTNSTALLRGDGTAENPGFFGLQGQAAVDGYAPTREAILKSRQDIAASIKSDKARQMFLDKANSRFEQIDNQGLNYVTGQRRVANDAVSAAREQSAASEAVLFWNDDTVVNRSLGIATVEAEARAARAGLPKEVAEAEVRAARTRVLAPAINAAIETDYKRAQKLYQDNVGSMDAREAAILAKRIQDKATVTESQKVGDQIYDLAKANGWSEERAMIELRKVSEGSVRDAAMRQLNSMFTSMRQSRQDAEQREDRAYTLRQRGITSDNQAFEAEQRARRREAQDAEDMGIAAAETIARMGGTPQEQLKLAQETLTGRILEIAEARLNSRRAAEVGAENAARGELRRRAYVEVDAGKDPDSLPPEFREALSNPGEMDRLRRVFLDRQAGIPAATNWEAWNAYQAQAKDPDQARFIDLKEARTYLADAEFRKLSGLVSDAQAGKLDPNAKNDNAEINRVLMGYEFVKTAKADDRNRLAAQIANEVDAVRAISPQGRVSPEERDKIISQAAARYVTGPRDLGIVTIGKPSENTRAVNADVNMGFDARAVRYFQSQAPAAAAKLKLDQPPPEAFAQAAGRISTGDRNLIIAAARAKGVQSPTEAEIRFIYAYRVWKDGSK
jgi:hypothetical protein